MPDPKQPQRGLGPRAGGQVGAGGRRGMNTSGLCVCPKCGRAVTHQRGQPCFEQKCPDCGATMTRGQ